MADADGSGMSAEVSGSVAWPYVGELAISICILSYGSVRLNPRLT